MFENQSPSARIGVKLLLGGADVIFKAQSNVSHHWSKVVVGRYQ